MAMQGAYTGSSKTATRQVVLDAQAWYVGQMYSYRLVSSCQYAQTFAAGGWNPDPAPNAIASIYS